MTDCCFPKEWKFLSLRTRSRRRGGKDIYGGHLAASLDYVTPCPPWRTWTSSFSLPVYKWYVLQHSAFSYQASVYNSSIKAS